MRVIPILFLLVSVSFSDTSTQTDWSGGGGVPGPVTDWGNSYDVVDLINDTGSSLCLASAEYTVDDSCDGARSAYAADIDGDGDTDILGAASDANDISWWENTDGTGTEWTEHLVDGDFPFACSVYPTDVDGDGDIDVLGAAYSADNISWWENSDTSPGVFLTEHLVEDDFYSVCWVYAADVDGDGDTDVLGAALNGNKISWWENTDGSGTSWIEHSVDGSFDGARSVYATDVDGDGDTDILGAAVLADDITWWENTDGTGTEWTEHLVDGDFDGAYSVYAADVDGDGNIDVLGAADNADMITWWNLTSFSPSGALESSILDAGWVDFWELFASNEQEPTGTSVGFQFRSSNDPSSMGAWSDTVFTANTDLSGILADSTDLVQYRVILQTTDPSVTPVLNDVTISYTIEVSIGDTNLEEISSWDLAPAANPSLSSFAVQVSVPQSVMVDLLLYDVTGRVIAQHSQELPGGEHSVSFNNLHEGVYFCTMRAGDFTATERIVVLK
ncbi:MAG: T9SS type A sorting domain-containing protein [Candidatus Sabulitectum sp.]|nr:T9SS type A sorting domain-containing protein [Candidatus Sabulitectum sp.]